MATLIPSLNSVKRKMTSGERRFAERLESHLEDDYLCWYDVPVGPRGIHPDFVVMHPRRGLLILEVKDWRRDNIHKMDRMTAYIHYANGLKKLLNPLEQARTYARAIVKALEKDPSLVRTNDNAHAGKLVCPWGYGVIFPNITRKTLAPSGLYEVLPENRVICQDEMTENVDPEVFQKQLWDMFTVNFNVLMTMPQIDRVRWHLFPQVRIGPQQQPLPLGGGSEEFETTLESIPDLIRVMDIQQEQLARSLGDGHRVIHGAAGSGKTMILGYRAIHLAQILTKPILILCFNRALAAYLEGMVNEKNLTGKITVRNFHRWCTDQLQLFGIDKPKVQGDAFFRHWLMQL
ncbi:MAG: NERD domain-containing protein/DEAD/DEAH box helicase [Gammaproteobacteria bacterium]